MLEFYKIAAKLPKTEQMIKDIESLNEVIKELASYCEKLVEENNKLKNELLDLKK